MLTYLLYIFYNYLYQESKHSIRDDIDELAKLLFYLILPFDNPMRFLLLNTLH